MVGAWGGYSNGNIPTSAMALTEPGDWCHPAMANAWYNLVRAIVARTNSWIGVNEAYRDLATQQYYYQQYQNGTGNVAAYPGTSNHGWGLAFDLENYESSWDVLVELAPQYGFSWATGRASGERWHWEYVGPLTGGAAGSGGAVASINDALGADYIKKLQTQLGVTADGDAGADTTKALQTFLGVHADGVFGAASIRSLQEFTGADVDGEWGAGTTASFKATIDNGSFKRPSGSVGDPDVLDAQQLLIKLGYNIVADGVKGADTLAAIKEFQAKNGLTVDGIAGDATKAKMRELVAGGTKPTDPTNGKLPKGYDYGLDVAYPQSAAFDWNTVGANHGFVIIKAAGAEDDAPNQIYGPANLTDKHLAGVRSAGSAIEVTGFYFFNNGTLPVAPQAAKFIEVVKSRIKPGDVVAIDIENSGAATPFNPAQTFEFCAAVEKALGIKSLIYLNRSDLNNSDWSVVATAGHKLWIALLDGEADGISKITNEWPYFGKAVVLQFSSTSGAPGYTGGTSIDRNIGNMAELKKLGFVKLPGTKPPVDPIDPLPPVDPNETPGWFKRFLEGLINFFKSFAGSKQ